MRHLLLAAVTCCLWLACSPLFAQSTEQRKELNDLKKDLGQITTLIRQKSYAEAQSIIDQANAKVTAIAKDLGVPRTDRKLQGLAKLIEDKAESVEIARARAEGRPPKIGVIFSEQIAGIINDKCVRCHGGANPRAQLDLSTFAGWKQGGRSGRLLVPGNPNASLLMHRLAQDAPQRPRMPQNGEPLSADELQLLARWIGEGGRYDFERDNVSMAELADPRLRDDPEIEIPRPAGKETVSFTKDIAPFVSNMCVRCHNENRRSGGLSLVNFYEMMRGGDSGRVIIPGNKEESRLFRLTGGLENPRMPADPNVRITRKNYDDLVKWFEEGNKFDGSDPKTPLRVYAEANTPTVADELAKLSPEQFNQMRKDRTEQACKRAQSSETFQSVESSDLLVYGNVSKERLDQIHGWAQSHLTNMKKVFPGGAGQAWKGRLAIIIMRDRFGYEEFNQSVNNRRAPREMTGHTVVTPEYQDAYIVLQDVGDESSTETGGLRVNLVDHMTGAYLSREGAQVPDWALRGTGLAVAAVEFRNNPYLRGLDNAAAQAVGSVLNPADVFNDGTFSPVTVGAVGFSLVKYMLQNGGPERFGNFIAAIRSGRTPEQAIRAVYNTDLATLGRAFLSDLRRGR